MKGLDQAARRVATARYTSSTTTEPITATSMLQRLRPVTPSAPKAANRKPPAIAPTMPSAMSSSMPLPSLLTILLAMNPAMSPRMIQLMIDIGVLHVVRGQDAGRVGSGAASQLRGIERIAGRRVARVETGHEI